MQENMWYFLISFQKGLQIMIDKKKKQKNYSKCKGNLLNELLMLYINWLNVCLVHALTMSKWYKKDKSSRHDTFGEDQELG